MADGDKLPSGHTISIIKDEDAERLKKFCLLYEDGAMRLNPGNWIMPTNFAKFAHLYFNFEVRSTDVFITTYPKSGTTWLQEIVWNLIRNPNLTNPEANVSTDVRMPTFEGDLYIAASGIPEEATPQANEGIMQIFNTLYPGKDWRDGLILPLSSLIPDPRIIKTHLPHCFLPPNMLDNAKVIYVAREPRDVMTSCYHFQKLHKVMDFKGTLRDYVDCIIRAEMLFDPYWEHVKLAWKNRDHPNMCFVFFEDLKQDPEAEVKRIDKFLGTNRNDQQIQNVVKHTSFGELKERSKDWPPTSHKGKLFNKDVAEKEGGFFRKGEIGDWVNCFTPEQVEKLNLWMSSNLQHFEDDYRYSIASDSPVSSAPQQN